MILIIISIISLGFVRFYPKGKSKWLWGFFALINFSVVAYLSISNHSKNEEIKRLAIDLDNIDRSMSKMDNNLNRASSEFSEFKSMVIYSKMNYLGLELRSSDGSVKINNGISRIVRKCVELNDDSIVVFEDRNSESLIDSLIKEYPLFPFGYLYKYLILTDIHIKEANAYRDEAIRLFKITTRIMGHNNEHDSCLKWLLKQNDFENKKNKCF